MIEISEPEDMIYCLKTEIIAIIILLIGSNIARAFSLARAFLIIKFRSAPGDPKDIAYVLFTMAAGLACGVGSLPEVETDQGTKTIPQAIASTPDIFCGTPEAAKVRAAQGFKYIAIGMEVTLIGSYLKNVINVAKA